MSFEDRVAAVGIATEFQDNCGQVFKGVDEDTDNVKTQVCLGG
jgi:magnesium chelatase subunit D